MSQVIVSNLNFCYLYYFSVYSVTLKESQIFIDHDHNMYIIKELNQEHERLIKSMMGLRPRQGNLMLVYRLFKSYPRLMRGLPSIRLK